MHALAYHGCPRLTGDLHILINSDRKNSARVIKALGKFGFGASGLSSEDFEKADNVIQLGVPPVRIDIFTSLTDVTWDECYANKVDDCYDNIPVSFIGKVQFIANKKNSVEVRIWLISRR